ncbi:MAG TPA: hypothetical protein VFH68_07600 [Polyangia bacterium]|nr:hypothetical protein [Polyangia bacterium]
MPVKLGVVSPGIGGFPDLATVMEPAVWLTPTTSGVLLAPTWGTTTLVPYDAGPARTLAPIAFPDATGIGADEAGVYWTRLHPGTIDAQAVGEIMLSPADGGPARSVWSTPTAYADPISITRTKDGGWVVLVLQKMDDLQDHTTVWTIDASGAARQIACSPAGASAPLIAPPAEAPDAFSFAVHDYSTGKRPIIRIAR